MKSFYCKDFSTKKRRCQWGARMGCYCPEGKRTAMTRAEVRELQKGKPDDPR